MTAIVLYFQVHQPDRIRRLGAADVAGQKDPFDTGLDRMVMQRVAKDCYGPANQVLRRAIERTDGAFRCAFSLTGTALRQMEEYAPEALGSFQELVATGQVEILAETSHHSLSSLANPDEFQAQVEFHDREVKRLFGVTPTTFRNTELIVDERIARRVEDMGYRCMLAEGADHVLRGRSPHHLYRPVGCKTLTLLPRSYRYSDDVAFRYSDPTWERRHFSADEFAGWLEQAGAEADVVMLGMDYETFGEHQASDTGVLDLLGALPGAILERGRFAFRTPAELGDVRPAGALAIPSPISWADERRRLDAWLGNPLQRSAHEELYGLYAQVRERAGDDPDLLETWRRLSTSDHVYYLYTRQHRDGGVHDYFSHYDSPQQAYAGYMNALEILRRRLAG